MTNVADRLAKAVKEKKSHVCAGLDPRIGQIPEHIKKRALREHGNTPEAVASAIVDFNTLIVDKTLDVVATYKPNIAFYEGLGPPGMRAFERTVDYIKSQGAVVTGDAKRNDIGSTAKAYADGHIGRIELIDGSHIPSIDVDVITVNPYLGTDAIKPFLEYCKEKGIYILCRTSNPSAKDIQDRLVDLDSDEIDLFAERLNDSGLSLLDLPAMKDEDGNRAPENEGKAPLYVVTAKLIDNWGRDFVGECGYSSVGAVVGATYPEEARILRKVMPNTWLLVPGYGAQGGKGEDIPNFVGDDGQGAVVNASRSVIFAYAREPWKGKYKPEQFAYASRAAVIAMRDDIAGALKKADKWSF